MTDFIPRLKRPEAGNPYYNRKANGGYNPCIPGNYPYNAAKTVGYPGLTVLPNCTGYATGRFAEIIGDPECKYFGKKDARDYYKVGRSQGLKTGNVPKLGSCIVWDDGKYGHVAIVEQIIDKETIVVSQSGWYSKVPMWKATHKIGNGNWIEGGDFYWMKKYTLIGFVYNPAVEEEEDLTEAETKKLIKEMFPGQWKEAMNEYLQYQANREDTWATIPIKEVEKLGIMVGDPSGNFRPNSWVTRAELAQVAMNIINYLSK